MCDKIHYKKKKKKELCVQVEWLTPPEILVKIVHNTL